MMGLMEFGGHVRLTARGRKWGRVKESECLTLGRNIGDKESRG